MLVNAEFGTYRGRLSKVRMRVSRQPMSSTVPSILRSGERIAEEVRQQILGGEAHGDAADAAEGEYPGDAETQGLQRHQGCGNNHRKAQQLGDGVDGGAVHRFALRFVVGDQIGFHHLDEAH